MEYVYTQRSIESAGLTGVGDVGGHGGSALSACCCRRCSERPDGSEGPHQLDRREAGDSATGAKRRLEAAISRSAFEDKKICILANENILVLSGSVLSPAARNAIELLAWKTPGIEHVQNDLHVEPLETVELTDIA